MVKFLQGKKIKNEKFLNLLTHNFEKLPMIFIACLQRNDIRLYHFLPKRIRTALKFSLADREKLLGGSSLSVLTASVMVGLELWLPVEISDWCSLNSASDFQYFNGNLPFLAFEPIQFSQNFAAKKVSPSPSTFATSNLSLTDLSAENSSAFDSDSSCVHNPALVI